MLPLLLITLYICNLSLASQHDKSLFTSFDKRPDSYLRRSIYPAYGRGGPRMWNRRPYQGNFQPGGYNRRKFFSLDEKDPGLPKIPFGDCVCGHAVGNSSHRPWMARINVNSGDGECSGSIINRRWIVGVASCFCGKVHNCSSSRTNFAKKVSGDELAKIQIIIGTGENLVALVGTAAIAQILINPQYEPTADDVPKSFNLALIELKKDLYDGDGKEDSNGNIIIQPICLPRSTRVQRDEDKYNDMDCIKRNGGQPDVPEFIKDNINGLACTKSTDMKMSQSFMSWYNMKTLKGFCRANSFSPDKSIFRRCESTTCSTDKNPSLELDSCKDIIRQRLHISQKHNNATSRIVVKMPNSSTEYCYPYEYNTHNPDWRNKYSNGWCYTNRANNEWGWCEQSCNSEYNNKANMGHEVQLDSFDYEGCAADSSTKDEFCTGIKITHPGQIKFEKEDGMKYNYDKEEHEAYNTDIIKEIRDAFSMTEKDIFQHHEPCLGQEGGSVWRLHNFYRNKNFTNKNGETQIGMTVAVLTGITTRIDTDCRKEGLEYGAKTHTAHTRIQNNMGWIEKTAFGQRSCGKTNMPFLFLIKNYTTPAPSVTAKTVTFWVTRTSLVCEEVTEVSLFRTMIPTCVWVEVVTTPKIPLTSCVVSWGTIIVHPPPKISTCITVTECITVPWHLVTKAVETTCITMITCTIIWKPINGSTVIPVTTCIWIDGPEPTCWITTCIPITLAPKNSTLLTGSTMPGNSTGKTVETTTEEGMTETTPDGDTEITPDGETDTTTDEEIETPKTTPRTQTNSPRVNIFTGETPDQTPVILSGSGEVDDNPGLSDAKPGNSQDDTAQPRQENTRRTRRPPRENQQQRRPRGPGRNQGKQRGNKRRPTEAPAETTIDYDDLYN